MEWNNPFGQTTTQGTTQSTCGSDCKHKHEVIQLKNKLSQSLSSTNTFISESMDHMNQLKGNLESQIQIIEEENRILRDKISILEYKNSELVDINQGKLEDINNKLKETEDRLKEAEKKETISKVEKPWERLYRNGVKKLSATGKNSLSKALSRSSQLP